MNNIDNKLQTSTELQPTSSIKTPTPEVKTENQEKLDQIVKNLHENLSSFENEKKILKDNCMTLLKEIPQEDLSKAQETLNKTTKDISKIAEKAKLLSNFLWNIDEAKESRWTAGTEGIVFASCSALLGLVFSPVIVFGLIFDTKDTKKILKNQVTLLNRAVNLVHCAFSSDATLLKEKTAKIAEAAQCLDELKQIEGTEEVKKSKSLLGRVNEATKTLAEVDPQRDSQSDSSKILGSFNPIQKDFRQFTEAESDIHSGLDKYVT